MTHGDDRFNFDGSDGKSYNLNEDIIRVINDENSKLGDIPKIVAIQVKQNDDNFFYLFHVKYLLKACTGDKIDNGVPAANQAEAVSTLDNADGRKKINELILSFSNTVVFLAGFPGYESYRRYTL